jgi:hypothetical protein
MQVYDTDAQTLTTVFDQLGDTIQSEDTLGIPSDYLVPVGVSLTSDSVLTVRLFCECHGGWAGDMNSVPNIEWDISGEPRILDRYWGPATIEILADSNERFWLGGEGEGCSDGAIHRCNTDELYYQVGEDTTILAQQYDIASSVRLAENGEKIVLIDRPWLLLGMEREFRSLIVVDRAGQVEKFRNTTIEQLNFYTDFAGSPMGFVYIATQESGDVLLQQDTRDLSQPPEVIWRSDLTGWEIIHTDPFTVEGELPPFSEFRLE